MTALLCTLALAGVGGVVAAVIVACRHARADFDAAAETGRFR